MKDHNCPRCKGTGKIKKARVFLKDKTQKYCPTCETIKPRDHFWRKESYCIICMNDNTKQFVKRKHQSVCKICGKQFFGRKKNQTLCSASCRGKNSVNIREYKRKMLIPLSTEEINNND